LGADAGLRLVEHFTLEDPNLHADDPVRGFRLAQTVVDIRTERVQRHASFAIALGPRDLGAVQASRNPNLHAQRADAHRIRHGPLHGATEHDAALELLRDAIRDQLCIELRLANFGDVDAHIGLRHLHHLRDLAAQLFDVLALLADHDAGSRSVNSDVHLACGALDMNAAYRGVR